MPHFKSTTLALAIFTVMLALVPAGCGGNAGRPALGRVHGRVTLDGQPLAHTVVIFQPEAGGRGSSGVTNDNGEYVLTYIRNDLGATVGKNSVQITNQRTHDPKSETVPAKYNRNTTLFQEVKSGNNEINFDLSLQ